MPARRISYADRVQGGAEMGAVYEVVIESATSLGFALALDARARTVVYAVRKGSVADTLGVRAPTFLVTFNGTSTEGLSLSKVQSGLVASLGASTPLELTFADPVHKEVSVPPPMVGEMTAEAARAVAKAEAVAAREANEAAEARAKAEFAAMAKAQAEATRAVILAREADAKHELETSFAARSAKKKEEEAAAARAEEEAKRALAGEAAAAEAELLAALSSAKKRMSGDQAAASFEAAIEANRSAPPETPPTPQGSAPMPWSEVGVQAGALEAVMNAASPRLSVTPSFPKAAYDGSGHAEIRAGIRLLSTGAGIGDAARPAANGDDGGAVSVKLGLGINTGAGIKDNSVGFKALGCGLQLGQRTGISFFDNEVVIDFKRLFGGRSEPIAEEEESAQAHELGLMDCITPSRSESRTTSGIPALTDAGSPHVRI